MTRAHSPRPGSAATQRMMPPISSRPSTRWTRLNAALREHDRALHAGRAGADDEDVVGGVRGALEPLGMPASAVLLAGGRVLRAADVAARVARDDAHVAADALADLVQPALLDLLRQERVGDRRPGGADDVRHAASGRLGHLSAFVKRPTPTIGLLGRAAHLARPLELAACREEARRAGVDRPLGDDRADVDVPEVDVAVGEPMNSRLSSSGTPAAAPPACRRRSAPRSRSRRPTASSRPARAARARTAPGSPASRRTRRCAGCRRARGTARAGRCARRRRRRCRSRRRGSARPPSPSRPGRGGYRPSSWPAG